MKSDSTSPRSSETLPFTNEFRMKWARVEEER